MSKEKEFKINEYITLKLEDNKTIIYVDGKQFRTCKYLLINIPKKDISKYDNLDSIDEVKQYLSNELEGGSETFQIDPVDEFHGHCSNLQAWVENDYDTRILEMSLAFPLLKRLAEVGDPKAQKKYKEEVKKRIVSGIERGFPNVIEYFLAQNSNIRHLKFDIETLDPKLLFDFCSKSEHKGTIGGFISLANFSPKLFEMLSNANSVFIRKNIATNPNIPEKILEFLRWDEEIKVRFAVANNNNTPIRFLRELLTDNVEKIRERALETLKYLTLQKGIKEIKIRDKIIEVFYQTLLDEQKNVSIRSEILNWLNSTGFPLKEDDEIKKMMEKLATDKNEEIRERVAQHSRATDKILKKLSNDESMKVIRSVAGNPNTPSEILQTMGNKKDYSLLNNLAQNSNTPTKILEEIFERNIPKPEGLLFPTIEGNLARNPNTPKEILKKLSNYNSKEIKTGIAKNPNTSPTTLKEIYDQGNRITLNQEIAKNPNTPTEVLRKMLKENKNWHKLKVDIAGNPNTPPDILAEIFKKTPNLLPQTLAENLLSHPNCPTQILKDADFHYGNEQEMRRLIAKSPNTPPEIFKKYAQEEDKRLKYILASNSSTPKSVLRELANESSDFIRIAIILNPNTPKEIFEKLKNEYNSSF